MNPDGLGVQDFYTATRLATHLEELHADFDSRLRGIQKKHKMKSRRVAFVPTEDDIADLFGLSFFKLITTTKTDDADKTTNKVPHGWFSGKPAEWYSTLKTCKGVIQKEEPPLPDLLSQCFNAFAKFFHLHATFHKKLPPSATKKVWPLSADDELDDFYAHDQDDIDTPENPFGWLFDDEDD